MEAVVAKILYYISGLEIYETRFKNIEIVSIQAACKFLYIPKRPTPTVHRTRITKNNIILSIGVIICAETKIMPQSETIIILEIKFIFTICGNFAVGEE